MSRTIILKLFSMKNGNIELHVKNPFTRFGQIGPLPLGLVWIGKRARDNRSATSRAQREVGVDERSRTYIEQSRDPAINAFV